MWRGPVAEPPTTRVVGGATVAVSRHLRCHGATGHRLCLLERVHAALHHYVKRARDSSIGEVD